MIDPQKVKKIQVIRTLPQCQAGVPCGIGRTPRLRKQTFAKDVGSKLFRSSKILMSIYFQASQRPIIDTVRRGTIKIF